MKQIVRNPELRQSAAFHDSSLKEHSEISIQQQIRSLQEEVISFTKSYFATYVFCPHIAAYSEKTAN